MKPEMEKSDGTRSPNLSAKSLVRFRWIYIVLLLGWIGMVVLFSLQERRLAREMTEKMVREQADTLISKDIVIRHWNSLHGGVYVPITENTQPNLFLSHVPHRDITTSDGRRLTLINPAYMTRQVHELQHQETSVQAHLSSLMPLNPINSPDAWEEAALKQCEAGETEITGIVENGGQFYLRLLRPMVIAEGCLECHASQGYKVGDIKGGISVTVPMAPYFAAQSLKGRTDIAIHAVLALLGAAFLTIGYIWVRRSEQHRLQDETNILRLSMAVEQSPALVVITDTTGNIEYVNPKFTEVTGYDFAEAVGRNPRILKSGAHGPDYYSNLWNTITSGGVWQGEFMNLKKSGESYWETASISPIKDASGRIINYLAVKEDITARKTIQHELVRQKEFVETVLNSIPEAISIIDVRDFTIKGANAAFLAEVGRSLDDVIGQTCHLITHGLNEKCAGKHHPCPLANIGREELPSVVEHRHLGPGDEEAYYEISVFPLKDESGEFNQAVHISRDITEQKLFEQTLDSARLQAEQASRAKSEFLANLSHEFRTPMNGIIGMTDLTLDTDLTPDQREYLTLARQAADALLRLLNDILDFSKIEAGKLDLDTEPFNLPENLAETVRSMSYQAEEKGIGLKLVIDQDTPENLVGDPGRLRQVIVNLLSNALKFTERGEIIVSVHPLSVTSKSTEILFSVSDTGIGIPEDHQKNIFSAFTQADGSITRKFGGTGLGLAICRRLVSMFGGRIWLESRENKGSTFYFNAFFNTAEKDDIRAEIMTDERLRGMTAMVVDNNTATREKVSAMLKSSGLHIRDAMDGPTAFQEINRAIESGYAPELILLDSNLPETDTVDLVDRLRNIPELRDTLLIMLSTDATTADAALYRRIGIDGYLNKPVRRSDLVGLIKQILLCAPHAYSVADPNLAASTPDASAAALKILVAEDNLVNQRLAESLLIKAGHRVILASDGVQAVAEVEKTPFDLVFLDIQMPEMDGLDAARRIREIDRLTGRHTPVVAMTAHALKGDRERFLNNGFDGYLAKPVSYKAVLEVLEMVHPSGHMPHSDRGSLKTSRGRSEPNLAALLAKTGGDRSLVHEMINIFLEELPGRMESIESAILETQHQKLETAAHSLKGSLGYFSISGAFESTSTLVEIARSKNLERAPAVFARLKDQTRRLESSLADWLNNLGVS